MDLWEEEVVVDFQIFQVSFYIFSYLIDIDLFVGGMGGGAGAANDLD